MPHKASPAVAPLIQVNDYGNWCNFSNVTTSYPSQVTLTMSGGFPQCTQVF